MSCRCARALCDQCVADGFAQLRGVGATRGEAWAVKVAKVSRRSEPWPAHEGKAAEIARRKVADLTSDPRLAELLAAELALWAAKRWSL